MQLAGKGAREAGARLDVEAVLEGTLTGGPSRPRVVAELVRVSDENTLWSGSFDVSSSGSPPFRDSLTRAIANAMRVRLAPRSGAVSVPARGTADDQAYDLFLRGEYHRRRYDLRTAVSFLERSVARDSMFGRAWASLGASYAILPFDGVSSPDSARTLATRSIDRALAIDAALPSTQFARGVLLFSNLRFAEAADAFRRVIAREPDNAEARTYLAGHLGTLGRLDDAMAEVLRARDLDPLSTDVLITVQYLLYAARRFREAVDATPAILAVDPNSTFAYLNVGVAYAFLGRPDSAVAAVDRALKIDPHSFGNRSWAMFVYAAAGRWASADEQRRLARREPGNSPNYPRAFAEVVAGNTDSAIVALERGIRGREPLFGNIFFSCDPIFDPLKSSSRFRALMGEVGANICPPTSRWPIPSRPR